MDTNIKLSEEEDGPLQLIENIKNKYFARRQLTDFNLENFKSPWDQRNLDNSDQKNNPDPVAREMFNDTTQQLTYYDKFLQFVKEPVRDCLLYTSPSPRD